MTKKVFWGQKIQNHAKIAYFLIFFAIWLQQYRGQIFRIFYIFFSENKIFKSKMTKNRKKQIFGPKYTKSQGSPCTDDIHICHGNFRMFVPLNPYKNVKQHREKDLTRSFSVIAISISVHRNGSTKRGSVFNVLRRINKETSFITHSGLQTY